jgi:hypothetical protein
VCLLELTLLPLQFVFLLAAFAIAAVSVHADGLDIQNAYVTVPKEYTWTSVDSGPLETHYKTWELLVGFITMESCKPQLLLQMCVHVQMCEVVFVASSQQAHRVCVSRMADDAGQPMRVRMLHGSRQLQVPRLLREGQVSCQKQVGSLPH